METQKSKQLYTDETPLYPGEQYDKIQKLKKIFWIFFGVGFILSFFWIVDFIISRKEYFIKEKRVKIVGLVSLCLFFVINGFILLMLALYAGNVF